MSSKIFIGDKDGNTTSLLTDTEDAAKEMGI